MGKLTPMNILVTGSSGTIGTGLCEALLQSKHTVFGVDWETNNWNATIQSVTTIADLRDAKALTALPTKIDMVIHLAANARVFELVEHPERAFDNIQSTFNALEFARKNNIKKFIFASSRETYGNLHAEKYTEDMASIDECESPYTASKVAGEALVQSYSRCYGIDHIIFRFSNVYGRYDDSVRVVPSFIRQALAGQTLTIFGKEKYLDFTYLDDAVAGIMQAINKFDSAKNEVINLAFGDGTLISEVAKLIIEHTKSTSTIQLGTIRTGEISHYVADISKAQLLLDYQPKHDLPTGLQKSLEWYTAYFSM